MDSLWSRNLCRAMVSPPYCECSGVTYDLPTSNIGGTYDLANQRNKCHFGQFLVVSQSQAGREFVVNLALTIQECYWPYCILNRYVGTIQSH